MSRPLVNFFERRIRRRVQNSFYLRYEYWYWLRNFEDGTILLWKVNPTGSPWIKKMVEAMEWLKKKEEECVSLKTVDVPTTKWGILRFSVVSVKAVINRQPLLGTGPLPPWLRNLAHSRNMVCLDTYKDNLCLWRCIAVHQGARITRCTRAARRLCQTFLETNARDPPRTSMDELDNVECFLNKNEKPTNWLHIRVFEPELHADDNVLWQLIRNVPGVYNEHAFFIKDIVKLPKINECADCNSRFTRPEDLKVHNQVCTKGQTLIWCGNKKVEKPRSSYLQAFFPDSQQHSKLALRWLSKIEKERKIHIHHSLCGHGGERQIWGGPVDGYHPKRETIFQFHGCYWHGYHKCYPNNRNRVLSSSSKTMQDKHEKTLARAAELRKNGFTT